jgi:hypothetical protein
VIPKGVTEIGFSAFDNCISLTEVSIPNSVTKIGNFAFGDCTALESVVIPEGVTSIGYAAFDGCTRLNEIYLHQNSRLKKKHLPAGVNVVRYTLDASGKKVKIIPGNAEKGQFGTKSPQLGR